MHSRAVCAGQVLWNSLTNQCMWSELRSKTCAEYSSVLGSLCGIA